MLASHATLAVIAASIIVTVLAWYVLKEKLYGEIRHAAWVGLIIAFVLLAGGYVVAREGGSPPSGDLLENNGFVVRSGTSICPLPPSQFSGCGAYLVPGNSSALLYLDLPDTDLPDKLWLAERLGLPDKYGTYTVTLSGYRENDTVIILLDRPGEEYNATLILSPNTLTLVVKVPRIPADQKYLIAIPERMGIDGGDADVVTVKRP